MTEINNLTQHEATPDQIAAGVVDPANHHRLRQLLTIQISGEPDGYAVLSEHGRNQMIQARVDMILQEFVYGTMAAMARNHFVEMLECGNDPRTFSDTDILNMSVYIPTPKFMVGGFHPLTQALIFRLRQLGCQPVIALSDRVTKEEQQPDGTVKKTAVFAHMGFDRA